MLLAQAELNKLQVLKKSLYVKPKPIIITRPIIIENYKVYCRTCAVTHTRNPIEYRTENKFNCCICKNPV